MGMATIAGMGDAIGMATRGALEAVIMATIGAAGAEMTRAKMIVAAGVEMIVGGGVAMIGVDGAVSTMDGAMSTGTGMMTRR